jgi:hypothetical protein
VAGDDQRTRSELEELVRELSAEVDRLRREIRELRRERHERPPHYE